MIAGAHLGHWYFQIAFAVPSVAIIVAVMRDSRRRRRRRPPETPPKSDR